MNYEPMHPPGYRLELRITSGARYYCHWEGNINSLGAAVQHNFRRAVLLPSREENINSLALRYNITSGARCWCHLGRKISIACALRYSIASGARCWCHLGRGNQ